MSSSPGSGTERLSSWAFALPEWKAGNLRQRMDEVTKAIDPPPEAEPESSSEATGEG